MNDTFNFKRFAGYTAKVYKENSRNYLMYALLLFCIQIGTILLTLDRRHPTVVVSFIIWISLLFGILFVFSEMKPFRNKHISIINNTLPVSYFEKYLLILLNTTLIYIIVYWGIFFIMTLLISGIFSYGDMTSYWLSEEGVFYRGNTTKIMAIFISMAIFAGTTNIKNHLLAFLIMMAVSLPLLTLPIFLPTWVSNASDEVIFWQYMFNRFELMVSSGETSVVYGNTPILGNFFRWLIGHEYNFFIWAILFLVAGYFNFKERQIK
ncbi:hypothetical protein [Proteiniphilum sp.]|uniref:hypothetical protein n=1 Tax=Proteiniphilum sp. TaxID=1926877 RepID=UPI002B1E95E3|nr:hypothetical protein [Proteiniphilum sp.]MEA4919093.1 hypothetical protein [Proteiniphilum sp.]